MSTFGTKCAGHEGAGEVVKVGTNVQGWKIGDHGGVKPLWDVCHNCESCWNGRFPPRVRSCRIMQADRASRTRELLPGWRLHWSCGAGNLLPVLEKPGKSVNVLKIFPNVHLHTFEAKYTSRIPEGVPDHVAGPIMCSASTMHRSLLDSCLRPGNFVVFPGGGGGVGIQGVQLAKYVSSESTRPCNILTIFLELWACDLS